MDERSSESVARGINMKIIIDLSDFDDDKIVIAHKLQDILLSYSTEGHALHLDNAKDSLLFSYINDQVIDGHRSDCPYFRAAPDCKDCECEILI